MCELLAQLAHLPSQLLLHCQLFFLSPVVRTVRRHDVVL